MQKAGLAEWGSAIRAQAKKESVCPVEAESAVVGGIQRGCLPEAACHCGEKIHVANAQLELKLGSSVGLYKQRRVIGLTSMGCNINGVTSS